MAANGDDVTRCAFQWCGVLFGGEKGGWDVGKMAGECWFKCCGEILDVDFVWLCHINSKSSAAECLRMPVLWCINAKLRSSTMRWTGLTSWISLIRNCKGQFPCLPKNVKWEFPAVSAHSFPAPPSGLPLAPWGWLKGLALSAERSHGHGPWWPWCEAKSNPSWDGYGDLMDFNGDFNGVQWEFTRPGYDIHSSPWFFDRWP